MFFNEKVQAKYICKEIVNIIAFFGLQCNLIHLNLIFVTLWYNED